MEPDHGREGPAASETELDRHLVELLLLVASGRPRIPGERVATMVEELLCIGPGRPRSYYLSGFARALLDVEFRAPPSRAGVLWERFGRFDAYVRQRRFDRAREMSSEQGFEALMEEPEIAPQVLAGLALACHECGDVAGALDSLERGLVPAPPPDLEKLANDITGAYLSRADGCMKDGRLEEARELLEAITRRSAVMEVLGMLAVRVYRKLGQCEQRAGDWEEAISWFQRGLEANPTASQHAVIWCDIGLCYLGLSSINNLSKGQRRDRRDEARDAFNRAVAAGEGFSINGAFALGVLYLEDGDSPRAVKLLEMAHKSIKAMKMKSRSRIEPRIRAYLGEGLLMGSDARRVLPKALNLLKQAQVSLSASPAERFETYRLLRTVEEEAARGYLSDLDLSSFKSFKEGVAIGAELIELAEPDKALEVAQGLMRLFLKKPDRCQALILKLRAENALADVRQGLQTYQELKQLCVQNDFHQELDDVLTDESATGEILDAVERKKECLELYGLMPERRVNRAALLLDVARSYVNLRDEESLRTAKELLEEASVYHAELPAEEIETLEERLEFEAQRLGVALGAQLGDEANLAHRLRGRFSSPPRILVVGGNEKQMGDHSSFLKLAEVLHFVPEWIPADYVNPDKPLSVVRNRLQQGLKGLILLHYNRTEFGRSARKLAGDHHVVLRNLHLYGFKSLRTCVVEVLEKILKMEEARSGT